VGLNPKTNKLLTIGVFVAKIKILVLYGLHTGVGGMEFHLKGHHSSVIIISFESF
jgi:hypothetical protein